MKAQFTVLFGPVADTKLSDLLSAVGKIAPLLEVKLIPPTNSGAGLPVIKTGITRHTVTEDDIKKMNAWRAIGWSAKDIAAEIPCAEITVRRHAPRLKELKQ